MNSEEQSIIDFMRQSPDAAYTRREIARKAVRRTEYEQNRNWADQPLAALVARGSVETDEGGLYHLAGRRDY
ncbi:MAG: hypothetical protein EPO07_19370 [Verrucomicrobia bacterium]|nr:MAG: hypothetical protein EPO07_19370 [Verrucomicrobiota bacterium]